MYFLHPYVFLFLLIPLLFFIRSFNTPKSSFETLFSKEMINKLSLHTHRFSTALKYKIFLLILVLFIIALARPVKELEDFSTTQSKPAVIIAVDMSKSMHTADIYPSRIALAKAKLKQFIVKANTLQVGIIFYAKDAYMLYPLSQDHDALMYMLKQAKLTHKFAPQSNLFSALEASENLLNKQHNKHIVLISDGGENIPRLQELNYLKSKHITLSALAITPIGNTALATLCQKSGGLYQPYSWGEEDINKLLANIVHSKSKKESYHYNLKQYDEYFTYPLFLALLLLLFLFLPQTSNVNSSVLLLFLVFHLLGETTPLHAGIFDFWSLHKAKNHYAHQEYKEAISLYKDVVSTPEGYYNLATALYASKNYLQAIYQYKKALTSNKKMNAKIYYNIANAYTRRNKLDSAKRFYLKSLASHHYTVAQENLILVTARLKEERKNLHKKYEKLYFKTISKNEYANDNAFSNYAIKLHHFMPTEEERWFHKILKHRSPLYLQKIETTKRSSDANKAW